MKNLKVKFNSLNEILFNITNIIIEFLLKIYDRIKNIWYFKL